jgi:hypothetical protein
MMRLGHGERGSVALEWLLTLPIVLLVGLTVVQLGLVYHARQALRYALHEAVRSASLNHAQPAALRAGLARGLAPWLYGADDPVEHRQNEVRAQLHLKHGELAGWIWLEQLSPHAESFRDWAEPASDGRGQMIPGMLEIPHDLLDARARRISPHSGVNGQRSGEPVGRASGQTLREANVLRVRLQYGVPLVVPVVGRLLAWTLRRWHGCPAGDPVYPVFFAPEDIRPLGMPDGRRCLMYGLGGQTAQPRLPLMLQASIVMHSPARRPR